MKIKIPAMIMNTVTLCANSRFIRQYGGGLSVFLIMAVVVAKNFASMLQQNLLWKHGEWYQFLAEPSIVGKAGLLDPAGMTSYYQALSISLGHQLIIQAINLLGYEKATALLYVMIIGVFATAIYLLSHHLTKSRLFAFVISFAILNSDALAMAHMAAGGHIAQGLVRDYLATGFVIISLYFLLKESFYTYFFFLFVGFLLHLIHGAFAFMILLPLTFMMRPSRGFLMFHIGAFAIAAMGLFAYASVGAVPIAADVQDLWFKWVYLFNGGHIFFDHSIGYYVPVYAYFSLVLAGIAISLEFPENRKLGLSVVAVWTLIAIVGTFFIYIVPTMLAYQLTPYRSSLLISTILLVLVIKFLLDQYLDSGSFLTKVVAIVGVLACVSGTFTGVTVAATIICGILAVASQGNRRILLIVMTAGCFGLFILTELEFKIYDAYVVARDQMYWWIFLFILAGTGVVRFFRPDLARWRNPLAVPALLLVLLLMIVPTRYVAPVAQPSIDKLSDFVKASKVVEENSAERDPVLSGPFIGMPMLEVTAHRGSILQLAKAHVPFMAPALLPEFSKALSALGVDIKSFDGNWITLLAVAEDAWLKGVTTEKAIQLGHQFEAPLLITYQEHTLDLPRLYSGTHFSVYKTSR